MRPLPLALVLGLLAGCTRASAAPAADLKIVGGPGSQDGRFATPRALAWDPRGYFYVVDKTGRIQKFDRSGKFVAGWSTPETDLGRPTGLAVDAQGSLFVADTHYHRILRYSPEGKLLESFGKEGRGPGEFLYPVGIALGPGGELYVSEFGGNDRIQVFDPDRRVVRSFGRYGEGPGEFKRPQGVALGRDRLYVADAANHRIQVLSPEGRPLASWGDLVYPYSVSVDSEGNVFVAEYGRHCVTKFTGEGRLLGRKGKAGTGPGELNTPWAALAAGDQVIVADALNHRVQIWPAKWVVAP
jgi:DNA-binding beta-propeller fold protein YncE